MPTRLEAGLWGLLGGVALLVGALIASFARVPKTVIASVMAFGSGVLTSAIAFHLMPQAAETGGLLASAIGSLGRAGAYLAGNAALARHGAPHRKRSGVVPGASGAEHAVAVREQLCPERLDPTVEVVLSSRHSSCSTEMPRNRPPPLRERYGQAWR